MDSLIIEELPYASNCAPMFTQLLDLQHPIWLDSAAPFSSRGRYDIFSAAPLKIIESINNKRTKTTNYETKLNLFDRVHEAVEALVPSVKNELKLPFCGGAMGYFGYDLGRELEQLQNRHDNDLATADSVVGIYNWAVIVDHRQQCSRLVAHPNCSPQHITAMRQRLLACEPNELSKLTLTQDFSANFSRADYGQAFDKIQQYITDGDCYQINLAQRFSTQYSGDPLAGYLALRQIAAAPFSAYFKTANSHILCMSPERFLQVKQRQVSTSPIKGTIARGDNPEQDSLLAQQLLTSPKNCAENLMIVDLLRNDLGKACVPGSIQVSKLFELQSFEAVHHLVSTISGQLRDNHTALTLLANCFPGGSITGAPKIRAMEIIEELEPHRRSAYCGSIGYISCDGQMDTNIAIRTMVCEQNNIHCWAGGGIVADSDCDEEYQECMAKVGSLLAALPR